MGLPFSRTKTDGAVSRQLARVSRLVDGSSQITQLVHQPVTQRLLAGPDAPAADGIDFRRRLLAAFRHALQELSIDMLNAFAQQVALRIAKRLLAGDQIGIVPRKKDTELKRSFFNSSLLINLPMITPIEPVIVPGCATIQ